MKTYQLILIMFIYLWFCSEAAQDLLLSPFKSIFSANKISLKENLPVKPTYGGTYYTKPERTKAKLWKELLDFFDSIRFPIIELWNKRNPSLSIGAYLSRLILAQTAEVNPTYPPKRHVREINALRRSLIQPRRQKRSKDGISTSILPLTTAMDLSITTKVPDSSDTTSKNSQVKTRTPKSDNKVRLLDFPHRNRENEELYPYIFPDQASKGIVVPPISNIVTEAVPFLPDIIMGSDHTQSQELLQALKILDRHNHKSEDSVETDHLEHFQSRYEFMEQILLNNDNNKLNTSTGHDANADVKDEIRNRIPVGASLPQESEVLLPESVLVEREAQMHPPLPQFEQYTGPPSPSPNPSMNLIQENLMSMITNLTQVMKTQHMSSSGYEKSMFPKENNMTHDVGVTSLTESDKISNYTFLGDSRNTSSYNSSMGVGTISTPGPVDIEKMLNMVNRMMENMERIPLSRETKILMTMLDKLSKEVFELGSSMSNGTQWKTALMQNIPSDTNLTEMNQERPLGQMNIRERTNLTLKEMQSTKKKINQSTEISLKPKVESEVNGSSSLTLKNRTKIANETLEHKKVLNSMLQQIQGVDNGLRMQSDSSDLSSPSILELMTIEDEIKNYTSSPLHMQTLRVPLSRTNILKLVIQAHLLNKTSTVENLQTSLINESQSRQLSPLPKSSRLQNQTISREHSIRFNHSNIPSHIGPLRSNQSNLSSTLDIFNESSHSRICHMCVNIFQGSHQFTGVQPNDSQSVKLGGLQLKSLLGDSLEPQGSFRAGSLLEGKHSPPRVSITQVNYSNRKFRPNSQDSGWIPSVPIGLQEQDQLSVGSSSTSLSHNSPVFFPSGAKTPSLRAVSFPTNKPFRSKLSSHSEGHHNDRQLALAAFNIDGPFVVSPSNLFPAPQEDPTHSNYAHSKLNPFLHANNRPRYKHAEEAQLSKGTFFARSLSSDGHVPWPIPTPKMPIW